MAGIRLRRWSDGDLPLLHLANAPEMTTHLGGPESDEQIRGRHAKYLRLNASGEARTFVIEHDGRPVGSVGWWMSEWQGADAHETGWFVVPEHQGRGVASSALALVLDDVREHATAPVLTAFPAATNVASNRVCERAGFHLAGTERLPHRDTVLTTNVWVLDLAPPGQRSP